MWMAVFEDVIKAKDELRWKEANWENEMAIVVMWAYNDIIIRNGKKTSRKQDEIFRKTISSMLELSILEDNPLLRAEMYREIGEFDRCLEILENLDLKEEYPAFVAKQIAKRAVQKDFMVFILQEETE